MIRHFAIQFMWLVCACMVWVFMPVVPCMAQESANLGIFNATADWGLIPEFVPKVGEEKIPGRVEIRREGGDVVYDVYGNGEGSLREFDEGFFLYFKQKGSCSITAWLRLINMPNVSGGLMIRDQAVPSNSRFFMITLASMVMKYKELIPYHYFLPNTFHRFDTTQKFTTYSYLDLGDAEVISSHLRNGIYLRISRYEQIDQYTSEFSLDGVEWFPSSSETLKLGDEPAYGLYVSSPFNVDHLAQVSFARVNLHPSLPFGVRSFASGVYSWEDILDVHLQLYNPADATASVQVVETIPKDCKILFADQGGRIGDREIDWNVGLPPGFTQLRYQLLTPNHVRQEKLSFYGTVGESAIQGRQILPVQYQMEKLDIVFMAIPFALGLFHLIIYYKLPKLKEHLLYALFLFCWTISFYFDVATVSREFYSFKLWAFLDFSLYALCAVFVLQFFYQVFQKPRPVYSRYIVPVTAVVIFILAIIAWLLEEPTTYFYHEGQLSLGDLFVIPALVLIVVFSLESIRYLLINCRWNSKDLAAVIAGGLIYSVVTLINSCGWISGSKWGVLGHYSTSSALLLFCLCVSYSLAYRFAKTYGNLEELNVELEDRVASRTAELEHANQELRELDQMKSHFVSQASHDLRTPLTAIKGSLDNLLIGIAGDLNEKQKKVMSRATKSVDRLTNLINDVLDLNRIETGRIVLEKTDVPFKTLVENIINENRQAADQKYIQLTFNANPGDYTIHVDGGKIERVVGELIGNAIKYTPGNGTVQVHLSQDDHTISLVVQDSGIGMTPEECTKIWERFYRTSSSKTFAKGSGLGLSIAKELVDLHGGSLEAVSDLGKGTTFALHLPKRDIKLA